MKRARTNRKGFSSVARTRGAAVTGEMKYFESLLSASALTASVDWTGTEHDPATLLTLFDPIVGAGVNQRIGKSVKVLKIKIKGIIASAPQIDQTAADGGSMIRMLLVQDMQTNSAQCQGEQVMAAPGTATSNLVNQSFQNIDNFGRFRVLKDITTNLQNPNMSYDGTNMEQAGLIRSFKMTAIFKNPVIVRFNATNGGTIADIVDNSFHFIAQTSNIALAPTISYNCRVCYKE